MMSARCSSLSHFSVLTLYHLSYKLSPKDVIKFCTECVLSEEGECDLPDAFYDASQLTP